MRAPPERMEEPMSEPKNPQPQKKKPYRKPVLETYGAVRDLTRSVTGSGKNDAGSSSKTKTG
jgi:hypothetical protein